MRPILLYEVQSLGSRGCILFELVALQAGVKLVKGYGYPDEGIVIDSDRQSEGGGDLGMAADCGLGSGEAEDGDFGIGDVLKGGEWG